jgi:hypothetical protein
MRLSAVLGVVVVAVVVVAGAFASGGSSISAAPTIAIGQQQFGNTASDSGHKSYGCSDTLHSWWKLPTIAGDQVTVDFEGGVYRIYAYSVDTTDFNVGSTQPSLDTQINSNDKGEWKFAAPVTGLMPLDFRNDNCYDEPPEGPYDFVVYIKHKLVTHLTAATSALLARARQAMPRTGNIAVQAFTADGKPVANREVGGTLTGYWDKAWHPLGKAVAKAGIVSVHYKLPASAAGPLRLQLNLGGGNYQGVKLSYRGLKV